MLVTEISLENSLLNQNRALRRLAFVIYVQRTAAPRHSAVVNDRAFFASDTFADEAVKGGSLFTIKIDFQSMTDGFVQEHAEPAGTKAKFHYSRQSLASVPQQTLL